MFNFEQWALRAKSAFAKVANMFAPHEQYRPAMRQRLGRRFKRPEQWDFREYAGDGFGWFQSRQTGNWRLHKITVRNGSDHVKKLYELE